MNKFNSERSSINVRIHRINDETHNNTEDYKVNNDNSPVNKIANMLNKGRKWSASSKSISSTVRNVLAKCN